MTPPARADLWAKPMTEVLGYPRFGAYGGDIGAHVTGFLGANDPDRVVGIYTHHPSLHPALLGVRRSRPRSMRTSRSGSPSTAPTARCKAPAPIRLPRPLQTHEPARLTQPRWVSAVGRPAG